MMKFYRAMLICLLWSSVTKAQVRYFAEKSLITFFSDAVLEDITAQNTKVTSIFDAVKGEVAFLLNIKDFQFEKKLMQVHFNEKYMESDKYPKSTFQGKVTGFNSSASGVQQVKAIGKLSIHGITRDVELPGTIEIKDNQLFIKSKFMVKLTDYNITVPQVVWRNIAQEIEVTADFTYRPL